MQVAVEAGKLDKFESEGGKDSRRVARAEAQSWQWRKRCFAGLDISEPRMGGLCKPTDR